MLSRLDLVFDRGSEPGVAWLSLRYWRRAIVWRGPQPSASRTGSASLVGSRPPSYPEPPHDGGDLRSAACICRAIRSAQMIRRPITRLSVLALLPMVAACG